MNIFVGNLAAETTETELTDLFKAFGQVKSVQVMREMFSGVSKGFGFIEMPGKAHSLAAIAALDGKDLHGKPLRVTRKRHRVPLVIVPPLAVNMLIYDLFPERSLVKYLLARGFDVYLIDGRFRVACFCQALLRAGPEARLMIHDYRSRPHYHPIETVAVPVAETEDLTVFTRRPGVEDERIRALIERYHDVVD